ncbi:MAG: hypothetical protein BWX88_05365 [Planctomycetes bacterium ADurb.Bin126]|nr:MAG: hypothetical protein BWX88_05365 [Planctomycetes bacterium ADurb.Bin126]
MTVPAMATPSDEPRFETLRERPDISPWSSSGKLDWTTVTEDVSMTPTPMPTRKRPGTNVRTFEVSRTSNSRRSTPATVTTNPARISVAWERLRASLPAAIEESRMPIVAGVRIRPVSIAL